MSRDLGHGSLSNYRCVLLTSTHVYQKMSPYEKQSRVRNLLSSTQQPSRHSSREFQLKAWVSIHSNASLAGRDREQRTICSTRLKHAQTSESSTPALPDRGLHLSSYSLQELVCQNLPSQLPMSTLSRALARFSSCRQLGQTSEQAASPQHFPALYDVDYGGIQVGFQAS